jgi:predicted O-methyltransferase YrrM
MNFNKLRTELEDVLAGKHDARFAEVLSHLHCMSTARVYAVINAVVSCMEPHELYVEVGCFQGGSLISSLIGNDAHAIGVDNYSEFRDTSNYERTLENINKFGMADRALLNNMSYEDFFSSLPKDFKIQVYFYDGAHAYEPQLAGMEAAWSHLQPGSIVIVDDLLYPPVNLAVNQFIANHINQIKPLLIIDSLGDTDPVWWNGVCCLRVI